MQTPFDLSGRTALVTGASRGLGRAMARGLAGAGADIIAVASKAENATQTIIEIENMGRRAIAFGCRQDDRDDIYHLVEQANMATDGVDILINAAGTIRREAAISHKDDDWDLVLETNLNGVFRLTRELGRGMLARGRGKIINVASLLSFQGGITVPGYAASKGALVQLTKALANEWAGKGVNVNAIAPGYFVTDNTAALRADESRSAEILSRIPAGQWGQPDDLAGAAIFLASDASNYVHGHTLIVDGGWMAR